MAIIFLLTNCPLLSQESPFFSSVITHAISSHFAPIRSASRFKTLSHKPNDYSIAQREIDFVKDRTATDEANFLFARSASFCNHSRALSAIVGAITYPHDRGSRCTRTYTDSFHRAETLSRLDTNFRE